MCIGKKIITVTLCILVSMKNEQLKPYLIMKHKHVRVAQPSWYNCSFERCVVSSNGGRLAIKTPFVLDFPGIFRTKRDWKNMNHGENLEKHV